MRSHEAFFYQGDVVLGVALSILTSPAFIYMIALLTLPYLEQTDQNPTPPERPRQVYAVIDDVAPQH